MQKYCKIAKVFMNNFIGEQNNLNVKLQRFVKQFKT